MQGRLRSPSEGADTILWLLGTKDELEPAELYFDRKRVKKHFFWFTKPSDEKAQKYYSLLGEFYVQ